MEVAAPNSSKFFKKAIHCDKEFVTLANTNNNDSVQNYSVSKSAILDSAGKQKTSDCEKNYSDKNINNSMLDKLQDTSNLQTENRSEVSDDNKISEIIESLTIAAGCVKQDEEPTVNYFRMHSSNNNFRFKFS